MRFDIEIDDSKMIEDSINVKITNPPFAFVDDDGHLSVYTYTNAIIQNLN